MTLHKINRKVVTLVNRAQKKNPLLRVQFGIRHAYGYGPNAAIVEFARHDAPNLEQVSYCCTNKTTPFSCDTVEDFFLEVDRILSL